MCGIVGYIGKRNAIPILIGGLKKLEYRGYDSAGLAFFNDDKITLIKSKGQIKALESKISDTWRSKVGIAHTRWATHGNPSEVNAHPHTDCSGRVFVCHNGIIENYKELKKGLISRGHKFKSETDTEVFAHLIEENLRYSPELAVAKSLKYIKGSYALSIIFTDYPDRIIATKNGNPLIIGIGKNENTIASDASAILNTTRDVVYMNDREMAVIKKDDIKLMDILRFSAKGLACAGTADGESAMGWENFDILSRKEKLKGNIIDSQKGGYKHFMFKEIFEQPETIKGSFHGRLFKKEGVVRFEELKNIKDKLQKIERIVITGCGSAYFAGFIGKLMIEELANIPCEIEMASELRYRPETEKRQNLAMVAISQSGETADTLAALRHFFDQDLLAKAGGSLRDRQAGASGKEEKKFITLGIINVVGSTISKEVDTIIYNHIGSEIGVASTKAFTSQLIIFVLLALFLGRERNVLSAKTGRNIIEETLKISVFVKKILGQEKKIKELAKKYKAYNNFLYIGRKYNLPVAFEGALKLKEVSYIHAEGYGAGEMKHGPIAMIDNNFPTIAIAPVDSVYDKTVSNIEEIRARHGKVIAITTEGNKNIENIVNDWLYIPKTLEMLTPILSVIPLQLFAYYIGVMRGYDVDKPRNLAKSVTVE